MMNSFFWDNLLKDIACFCLQRATTEACGHSHKARCTLLTENQAQKGRNMFCHLCSGLHGQLLGSSGRWGDESRHRSRLHTRTCPCFLWKDRRSFSEHTCYMVRQSTAADVQKIKTLLTRRTATFSAQRIWDLLTTLPLKSIKDKSIHISWKALLGWWLGR